MASLNQIIGNKQVASAFLNENQMKLSTERREEELKNQGGFFGGLGYAFEKIGLGFLSAVEGIWDYTAGGLAKLFGADEWAEEQFANDWVNYNHADEWFNPDDGWKVVGDITQGIGNSLPSLLVLTAVGAATGGAAIPAMVGTFLMSGLSAAGNATKEAYRQTGELGGKEFGYGALVGGLEGAVETFSDAVLGGVGGQITKGFRSLTGDVAASAARQTFGKTLAKSFLSEGFEEVVGEFADPYFKRWTYDPTAENATLGELAYAGFVGGMSGLIMSGVGSTVSNARVLHNGSKAVTNGRVNEIFQNAQNITSYEAENHTDMEAFKSVSDTYARLQESLKKTNGNVETVRQKYLLGRLEIANTAAIFEPTIQSSARNAYENADAIAQRMTEFGYTDESGKPVVVTADQIREGIDAEHGEKAFRKSFSQALRTNSVLRTIAVLDATNKLLIDAKQFSDATVRGRALASQVDLNRFLEATESEEGLKQRAAVAQRLGIEDWNTISAEELNQKIEEFSQDGGPEEYRAERADLQQVQSIAPEAAQSLPASVVLEDGAAVRYSLGENQFAVERHGDNYRVYDYISGRLTKNLTQAQLDSFVSELHNEAAQGTPTQPATAQTASNPTNTAETAQTAQEGSQERVNAQPATEETARETVREAMGSEAQEIDAYARQNVEDYNKLGGANQSMIRSIIRQGRAHGISETDIRSYARVAAHTGVNIVFDKSKCYVAANAETGEPVYSDGYYDAESNQIVVNPQSTRTAESLLLHEFTHALQRTKGGRALLKLAFKNMSKDDKVAIVQRYLAAGRTNAVEIRDEIPAHYAEGILSSETILDRLLADKPNARARFLDFFKRAKTVYASDKQLSREASRLYKQYKKWFDKFSSANAFSNAREIQGKKTAGQQETGEVRHALDMSKKQDKTSAATSINSSKLPAVFSRVQFKRGTVNLDIGGGKFDNATEFLATQDVKNYIYDPYNRSEAHNRAAARATENGQSDTVTISNVLNVIDTLEGRQQVLANAVDALKPDGTAYITVYEGNGSGEARTTGADQFQLNRKLRDYLPEVRQFFDDVTVKNGVIIARSPIKTTSEQNGGKRYALQIGDETVTVGSTETKNLVALHNLSEEKLRKVIDLGGFPMPSIAITRVDLPHDSYGDITVVFGRDTISPTDRRNKVYPRDAWTPTVPRVDVKFNTSELQAVKREMYKRVEGVEAYKHDIENFFDEFSASNGEYYIRDRDFDSYSIARRAERSAGVVAAYLSEKGLSAEPVYREKKYLGRDFSVSDILSICKKIGITQENLDEYSMAYHKSNTTQVSQYEKIVQELKSAYREYYTKRGVDEKTTDKLVGDIEFNDVWRFTDAARQALKNPNETMEYDPHATEDALSERIEDKADFEKWIFGKISATEESRGIENGRDVFTPSGSRRSFAQLHDAYTLENIVRAMQKKDAHGDTMFGHNANSIAARLADEFTSIESIREASSLLTEVSESDYDALMEKTFDISQEIVSKIDTRSNSNSLSDAMNRREDILDMIAQCATVRPLTPARILSEWNRQYSGYDLGYRFNMSTAQEVYDWFALLKQIPTRYFEAKPRRAVQLSEIKEIIVPDTASKDLLQLLDKRGLHYITYAKGESRSEIIKKIDRDGVRFALPETQESRRIKPIAGQMDIFRDIIGAQTDTQSRAWDSDYSKQASTNVEDIIKLLKERGYENAVSGADNGSGRGLGSDGRNGKGSRVYDFGAIRRIFEAQGTRTQEESKLYSKIVKELGGYSLKSPTLTSAYQIGVIDEAFYTYDMLRIADVNAKNGVGTVFYLDQEFYKRGKKQTSMLGCYIVGGNNVYISSLLSTHGSRIPFESKRVSPWSGRTTYEFDVLQAWGKDGRYAATRNYEESIRNVMRHERLHLMYNAAAKNPSKFGEKANAAAIELKRFVESRFAGRVDDLHRAVKDYYVKELGYGKVEAAIEEIACDLYSGSLVLNENTDAAEIQRLVDAIDNSLTDIKGADGVRYALPSTDSEGTALSEQQRKFFADSKVVDDKGNLLVVYHGTPRGGFTVFETEYDGAYFTADEKYATEYSRGAVPQVYKGYLNITKPFDTRNEADRKLFYDEFYRKWGNGSDLSARGLPDWTDGSDLVEFLKERGYDGMLIDEGGVPDGNGGVRDRGISYVIFDSSQFKNTDNKSPTKAKDIRFALSENGNSRRPFSRGQRAKFTANNTRFKVYSRVEAQDVINSIIDERLDFGDRYGYLSGKSKEQVIDMLFQKLNSTPTGYQIGVALDIADYIIENAYLEDMYAAEAREEAVSEAMGTLSILRSYMHRMDLRGIKGEIQYRYDKKNAINLVWGAKEGGIAPDQVAQELESYGIYLKAINEADQFFEMLDMYESARAIVNERAEKVKLSTYGGAEQIESLRQDIARDILRAYDTKGSKSKFAKLVEQYNQRIESLKQEVREAGRRNKLTNSIIDTAQYLRDIATKRKYVGADVFSAPELTAWLKNLGKMKYRSDLRKAGARQILLDYGKFYNTSNPLLYDADPNLSYIDENVLDALAFIKQNEGSAKPLSTEELQAAQVVMLSAKHLFDNYDQIIMEGKKVSVTELATQGNEILQRSKNHTGRSIFNTLYGVTNKIIEPRAVIRSLENYDPNGVLTRAYKAITDGETAAGLRYIELMTNFDSFLAEHKKYNKRLSSTYITVAGADLTVGQAISLYELSKRGQARDGLFEAGFSYMDQRGAKKSARITESDIAALEKQFTAEDKEFIAIVEDFFNVQSKQLKTKADMQILGYTNASDEFYFPIKRDQGTIARNITDARSIMADWANVYNFSFNKDVKTGAKNKLFITGVYDVVTRHAKQLSTYAELTVPLKNFSQIYSKNIGTKTNAVSMRNTLNEQIWGRTDDYLSKLFKDIQGTATSNSIIEKLRGAYAKYQLGANLKVIVSQVTSYPTAGIYLDVASMTRGAVMRTNWEAMDKYCPYARVRNYERGIVRAEGVVDKVGKVGDVLTKPIQWTDRATIGKLWNACQVQIERNGGAKVGTQENMEKAGVLLEDVIRLTQPNYTNTERSELMRSDSDIVRSFTMFTSVPLKQLSRFVESFGEYRALRQAIKSGNADAETQARYKQASKRLRRTFASITIANLMYCLVGQFFKWLYDKDRKDKDGNEISFVQDFFNDFVSTSIGMFPVVKDIYNYFANDYEFNNFAYETVNSILSASQELFDLATKAAGGEVTETSDYMRAFRNSLYAIGQLTGLPFRNINNTISGLIKRFDPATAYKYNSLFYNAQYSSDIKAALEKGDTKLADTIMALLLNERGASGLSDAARAKMIELYEKGYDVLPRTVGDKITFNGEERTISAKERNTITAAHEAASAEVGKIVSSRTFKNLSEAAQAKAIKKTYDSHYEEALAGLYGVPIDDKFTIVSKAIGITKAAPVIAGASELTSEKIGGQIVQGSRKNKVVSYLQSQSMLDAERLLLLYYLGYKIGDGEYKGMTAKAIQRLLAQYITQRKLSREEKTALAEMCGLTVKNGRIYITAA